MREGLGNVSVLNHSLFRHFPQPGEKVIWSGRPCRLRWIASDNWQPLVLAFMGLSLFPGGVAMADLIQFCSRWGWGAILGRWQSLAVVIAVNALFIFIAIRLIGRRVRRLLCLVYALTNLRAISVEQGGKPKLSSSALDLVNRFGTSMRHDGSGDLVFGYRSEEVEEVGWVERPRLTLEDISDVRRVLSLAQEALAKLGYQPVS